MTLQTEKDHEENLADAVKKQQLKAARQIPKRSRLTYAALSTFALVLFYNIAFKPHVHTLEENPCIDLELVVEAAKATMSTTHKYPDGFCQRVPLYQSSLWTWKSNAQKLLDATYNATVDGPQYPQWMLDLLRLLHMPRAIRQKPQHEAWAQFLNKIELRVLHPEFTSAVKVLILTGPSTPTCGGDLRSDCSWPVRLQQLLDTIAGPHVFTIVVKNLQYGTTELYTHALATHQLGESAQNPDLIVWSMSAQDARMDSTYDTVRPRPNRNNRQHSILLRVQHLVRAALQSRPCDDDAAPPMVLLDDDVGDSSVTEDTSYFMTSTPGRALQQVADHYRIAYVSYASLIQRFVAVDDASPFRATATHAQQQQHGGTNNNNIQQVTIMWSLLYAALDFSIDYCGSNHEDAARQRIVRDTPLMDTKVSDLVNYYMPPLLTANLLWTNVNEQWKESAKAQRARSEQVCEKQEQVMTRQCLLRVWGRGGDEWMDEHALRRELKPFVKQHRGWRILDGGILRAVQENALVQLTVSAENNNIDAAVDEATLFLGAGDLELLKNPKAQLEFPQLEWTITYGNTTVTRIVSTTDSLVVTQELFGIRVGVSIDMTLKLIAGNNIDIHGLFLCTASDVMISQF
jgi:hypothetical protein